MAPSVFNFTNYKAFVRTSLEARDEKKRGQYRAMAKHLHVHASLLSHVFRGPKNITPEQACSLAEFLALGDLETDYLVAMILAAGLEDIATADSIAARLRLPLEVVETALRFLVSAGLLERHGDRYTVETKRTHLSAKSPLAAVHHRNWRAKAMTMYDHIRQTDFVFTAAVALSIEDGREPTAGEPARATAGAAAEPRGLALAQAASAAVHRGSFQAARGGGASGPFARIGSGAVVRACRPAPGLGGALLRRPGRHRRALLKDAVKQRINTPPLPAADSRANELPAKDRYGKLVARVKAAVSSGKTLLHELPHDDLTPRAPGGALEG